MPVAAAFAPDGFVVGAELRSPLERENPVPGRGILCAPRLTSMQAHLRNIGDEMRKLGERLRACAMLTRSGRRERKVIMSCGCAVK